MAKPDAAREPSMEEILASIRQIISDDSTAEAQDADVTAPDHSDEGATTDAASDIETAGAAQEILDSEFSNFDFAEDADGGPGSDGAQAESAAATDIDAGSGSAEIAEDISREPDEDAGFTIEIPGDVSLEATREVETQAESIDEDDNAEADAADTGAGDSADIDTVAEPSPLQGGLVADTFDTPPVQDSRQQQDSENVANQAAQQDPAPGDNTEDDLISSDPSEAVAGAFNALTHTILAQNARTLDDLVQEMLSPMLREWLDENLPGIVERMVKDEIDRLSRGRS